MYRLGHYGPNRVATSQMAARARRRKVFRPDRVSGDEARSLPARSACFAHPVRMNQRGVRAAAEKVCLEIYNDDSVMATADAEFRTRDPLMAVKRFYHSTNYASTWGYSEGTPLEKLFVTATHTLHILLTCL